jgi:hypothetical protein
MKRFFLSLFLIWIFNFYLNAQTFQKSFDEPMALDEWSSNDKSNWQIVSTSTLAGNLSLSNTLKLNAPSGEGEQYLSIQNTENWGDEQTWSFWIGRDKQSFTSDNKCYVWLWADRADFKDPEINGYRLRIGDNTQSSDDLVLEKIINGDAELLVADGKEQNNVIPNGLVNYGIVVQIIRTKNSNWGIYTSATPTNGGGVNALTDPSVANTPFDRNLIDVIMHDDTFTNFENGFLGITAVHSSEVEARTSLEFDQFMFSNDVDYQEYSWNGPSNNYSSPDSWTPSRDHTRMTDVLNFSSTGIAMIQQVTSEVISSVNVTNSSTVIFNNVEAVELTVLGDNGPGLKIENASHLIISSGFLFNMVFPVAAKGEIAGTLTVAQSGQDVPHKISLSDERALLVKGSIMQECSGNLFGTSIKSENNVVFEAGSAFISRNGGSPFGLVAPASKVIFEDGSTYIHEQNTSFGTTNRCYANFMLKGTVTLSSFSNQSLAVNEFAIAVGSLTINNSATNFSLIVKGNLSIASTSTINLNSTSLIEMKGENKSLFGGDRIIFTPGSALKISNNISLQDPLAVNGTLILQDGVFNLNNQTLTLSPNSTIQKINGSLSSVPESNPDINYIYGDGGENNPKILTGVELQDNVRSISINNSGGVKLNKASFISNNLNLQKGKLISDGVNFLTLSTSATISNSSDESFVEGPIAKIVNSTVEFQFPIGAGGKIRPLSILPTLSDPTTYKATYFNTTPFFENPSVDIKAVSKVEYWTVERTGSGKARVKLGWDENSGINESRIPNLRIARFDGVSWTNEGSEPIDDSHILSNELLDYGLLTFGSADETIFPVLFSSFTGQLKNGVAELLWFTSLELNNKGFEIEKSLDGVEFHKIGFVDPRGDNPNGAKYSYFDYDFSQTSYYRIKQIDFNEQFKFSNVIVVKTNPKGTFSVSPNPCISTVILNSSVPDSGLNSIDLLISNLQGVELTRFKGNLGEVNDKLNRFLYNSKDGLYLLKLIANGHVEIVKLFKGESYSRTTMN